MATKKRRGSEIVVISAVFAAFLATTYGFGVYLFPVALPDMRADLKFDFSVAGFVSGAGQAGFIAASLAAGFLSPRLGAGKMVIGSMTISALAVLGVSIIHGVPELATLLTLTGCMAASIWVPMVGIIGSKIPENRRGTVFGLLSGSGGYGAVANGFLVPIVTAYASWRTVWATAGGLMVLFAVIGALLLWRIGALRKDDYESKPKGSASHERLISRISVSIWAMMFFCGTACMPYQTYLASYLREEAGFSSAESGQLWTLIGIVGIFAGILVGRLADAVGLRTCLCLSAALIAAAGGSLVATPTLQTAIASAVFFALSFYAIFGLMPAYISRMVSLEFSTKIFGIGNIMAGLGGILGNIAGGGIKEHFGAFSTTYAAVTIAAGVLLAIAASLPSDRLVKATAGAR